MTRIERAVLSDSIKPERLYTRAEAAIALGVSDRTIDRLREENRLVTVQQGRSVRVTGRSLACLYHDHQHSVAEVLKI